KRRSSTRLSSHPRTGRRRAHQAFEGQRNKLWTARPRLPSRQEVPHATTSLAVKESSTQPQRSSPMVLHFLRRWLNNLTSKRAAGRHFGKHRPGSCRPQVEALEDRTVPAEAATSDKFGVVATLAPQLISALHLTPAQA